jgi:hypothetical protein
MVPHPEPLSFWLLTDSPSCRIETAPGVHSIVSYETSETHVVRLDDRELNDNEALREAIQAALDGDSKAPGYQGCDASLTASQAAADAAWDAAHSSDRPGTAYEIVKTPAWLRMLREAGAL